VTGAWFTLVRPDDNHIANLKVGNRDFHHRTVTPHLRLLRSQLGQRFDGAARPPHGVVFERMAKAEQEQ
jgi:hypothetical protein